MKELDTWEAMKWAFEYYGKNTITVLEFNQWCNKYGEEHPDTYSYICRDDIAHEHECGRIWWEIRNDKPDLLHKQESVQCTTCGSRHYKYPNVEIYEKIIEMLSHIKKLEDLWSSK